MRDLSETHEDAMNSLRSWDDARRLVSLVGCLTDAAEWSMEGGSGGVFTDVWNSQGFSGHGASILEALEDAFEDRT